MLKETIAQTAAVVTRGPLPTVMAVSPSDQGQLPDLVFLFENLINNALKYRSPDRSPRIQVAAQRQGADWRFSFKDNGIGIEAQYFDGSVECQIFDMFRRLHSESKIPGHGIGLAYCKRVVESLGGKIWVESEVGKGSTFLFTLPASADERAIEPPSAPGPVRSGPPPAPDSVPTSPTAQIGPRKKKPGGRAKTPKKEVPRPGYRRK
jgi:light-regulated signal transduction histidine kinase (bacteriophytochrome)